MREFLKAFGCLTRNQREALLLAVLEGFSYRQIATHCAVSIGTVKSRIWRARMILGELLTGDGAMNDQAIVQAFSAGRPALPETTAAAA